jgi:hypothetical protein
MAERRRLRESGGPEGRNERPATGRGHPRPPRRVASAGHSKTAKVEVADGETSLPEPDVLQIHGGHTMTLQFKDIAIRCLEQH